MLHFTKRVIKIVLGFVLLLGGLVLSIPLVPGPGFVFVLAGLALLATEFHWARRLLDYLKARFRQFRDAAFRSEKKENPPAAPGSPPGSTD